LLLLLLLSPWAGSNSFPRPWPCPPDILDSSDPDPGPEAEPELRLEPERRSAREEDGDWCRSCFQDPGASGSALLGR